MHDIIFTQVIRRIMELLPLVGPPSSNSCMSGINVEELPQNIYENETGLLIAGKLA